MSLSALLAMAKRATEPELSSIRSTLARGGIYELGIEGRKTPFLAEVTGFRSDGKVAFLAGGGAIRDRILRVSGSYGHVREVRTTSTGPWRRVNYWMASSRPAGADAQIDEARAKKIMALGEWVKLNDGSYQWRWLGLTYANVEDRRPFSKSAERYVVEDEATGHRVSFERLRDAKLYAVLTQAVPALIGDGYLAPGLSPEAAAQHLAGMTR